MSNKIKLQSYLWLLVVLVISSCSTNKYAATNKVYKEKAKVFGETLKSFPPVDQVIDSIPLTQQFFIGSVNFGIRKPNYIVLHHTAQKSTDQTIRTFLLTGPQTSAHYIVGRDGKVVHMVNDYLRANHAGVGKWGNNADLNSTSLGIELDNNGDEPYSEAQLTSLLLLLSDLKKTYNIPAANFIGHSDIAPGRKIDPNKFPWKRLADKGFGLWYDEVLEFPPSNFDAVAALRIIGYNVSNLPAAINAFKRHFVQTEVNSILTPGDQMILYNLYKKYL